MLGPLGVRLLRRVALAAALVSSIRRRGCIHGRLVRHDDRPQEPASVNQNQQQQQQQCAEDAGAAYSRRIGTSKRASRSADVGASASAAPLFDGGDDDDEDIVLLGSTRLAA